MDLDNVKVRAYVEFDKATCPKHRTDMLELANGWFSVCWYCEKCGYPYHLVMRKMAVVNKENLKKAIEAARKETNHSKAPLPDKGENK